MVPAAPHKKKRQQKNRNRRAHADETHTRMHTSKRGLATRTANAIDSAALLTIDARHAIAGALQRMTWLVAISVTAEFYRCTRRRAAREAER